MTISLIETDDKIRAEKCLAAIQNILQQFACQIIPQVIITGVRLETGFIIAANPRIPPGDPHKN